MEITNIPINSSVVETKNNHIFNNVFLTSKFQIIKALHKLDMAIV